MITKPRCDNDAQLWVPPRLELQPTLNVRLVSGSSGRAAPAITPTPTGLPVVDPFSSSDCGHFGVVVVGAIGLDPFPLVPSGGSNVVEWFDPAGGSEINTVPGDPNFGHPCRAVNSEFGKIAVYLFDVPPPPALGDPDPLAHDPILTPGYYDGCLGRFLAYHLQIHQAGDFVRGDCATTGTWHSDSWQNEDFTGYVENNGTVLSAGNGHAFPATEPGILVTFSGTTTNTGSASVTPVPVGALGPIRDAGTFTNGITPFPPPSAPPGSPAWMNSGVQSIGANTAISGKLLMTLNCCPPAIVDNEFEWVGFVVSIGVPTQ